MLLSEAAKLLLVPCRIRILDQLGEHTVFPEQSFTAWRLVRTTNYFQDHCNSLLDSILPLRPRREQSSRETLHVPLNAPALAALAELRKRADGTGPVVRNPQGEPLAGPRHWFEPAIRKAKIRDFSWHCLRHTFASRLVMAGVDLRTVQELMGHKSISMTVRYSHLTPKHTLAAVERLAGVVSETPTDTKTSTDATEQIPADTAYIQ